MKKTIEIFKRFVPLYYLIILTKKLRADFFSWKYTDEELIRRAYKRSVGVELNLKNPLRFTEKMQWLKLNGCTPLMSLCADKFAVRNYIEEKGFGDSLNELIKTYNNVNEINIKDLPDKFVLKTTHSSGWNIICTDKIEWIKNWFWWKRILSVWLKEDYSKYYQERHYKNIIPKIVCEKFLGDSTNGLNDYKFYCFNGIVKIIQVDIERYTNHKQNIYDVNWNYIPLNAGVENYSDHNLNKPKRLKEMIKISESLSEGFPFARIDLFEWEDKIYFGEITFFDGSGYYKTEPEDFDFKMGKLLKLDSV